MVVGAKVTIQTVPCKGRTSIIKLHSLTVKRRNPALKIIYGSLILVIGLIIVFINPIELISDWVLVVKEDSYLYKLWETPPYQLFTEVWVFNYTNVPQFLAGKDAVLKVEEVGPFVYQETRTNINISVDYERGVMRMVPRTSLSFLKDLSVGDTKEVNITVPNIALLAVSTLLADKLGYIANLGAYYSINALGSKLFRNLTVEELLWGYEDRIITIGNKLLPAWIDFEKIGILDRFYAPKNDEVEVEIANEDNKFSIVSWNDSPGIPEQGFTSLETSKPCNRVQGTYEGLMLAPNWNKSRDIAVFRRQACRVFPLSYEAELKHRYGFNYYRFTMTDNAFTNSSLYACNCKSSCLPDGFVDVSNCYYGFPISLSKPHFLDTDPVQTSHYEGLKPDPERHVSTLDLEPTMGIPLAFKSMFQVNVAVRMNAGNTVTMLLKDKIVPIMWISLHCEEPPQVNLNLLWVRLVLAPPLIIIIEACLLFSGFVLTVSGCYRFFKPRYTISEPNEDQETFLSSPSAFGIARYEGDLFTKEAISMLTLKKQELVMDLPRSYSDT
ncbi:hypothetical protein ACJJTC_003621 [Scirpophaga incertulas]